MGMRLVAPFSYPANKDVTTMKTVFRGIDLLSDHACPCTFRQLYLFREFVFHACAEAGGNLGVQILACWFQVTAR